ncbi:MAG: cytochrome c biogenesis protein ResB [Candidatus Omnitrophica bacterium]|nr:cytochrome c biogenesis protein ResB [Candidatus Omnitrophota bacterium]
MGSLRKNLQRNPAIKFCASLKITLTCLILLFILTFWGTIDQVYNGLYLAQQRFFNSFVFIFAGFIPFPGAQLVLWVFSINLVCVAIVRLVYKWSHIGLIVTHFGLLLFFVAAFVTLHGVEESHLTLMEGEAANVSSAYHDWEIAVWKESGSEKDVTAYDVEGLRPGRRLEFQEGLTLAVDHCYSNSEAYSGAEGAGTVLGASGIQTLKQAAPNKEPEKDLPGCILAVEGAGPVILYGAEDKPLKVSMDGRDHFLQLRRKNFPLPFLLRLKDFTVEWYPNTEVARSYKSLVEIIPPGGAGASREVLISMNKPLRYKNFTLYQSSYSVDNLGRESSTLAVVKNAGRLLPYFASFITFGGLALHFLLMAIRAKLKH